MKLKAGDKVTIPDRQGIKAAVVEYMSPSNKIVVVRDQNGDLWKGHEDRFEKET